MRATIKLKLTAILSVIIVLAGAMAWLGISRLGALDTSMEDVLQGPVKLNQVITDMQADLLQALRAEKNEILAETPEKAKQYDTELAKFRGQFTARLAKYESMASPEGKRLIAPIHEPLQQWMAVSDKVRALAIANQDSQARALSEGQGRTLVKEITKPLDAVVELNHRMMAKAKENSTRQYNEAFRLLLGAAAAVLLIAMASGLWLLLNINRGLKLAGSLADAVAIGDLDQQSRCAVMTRSRTWSPRSPE